MAKKKRPDRKHQLLVEVKTIAWQRVDALHVMVSYSSCQ